MCIPGVPKKASPQIQNKERVTVRECKNLYLVKVIELRVIHLLMIKLNKNILESD